MIVCLKPSILRATCPWLRTGPGRKKQHPQKSGFWFPKGCFASPTCKASVSHAGKERTPEKWKSEIGISPAMQSRTWKKNMPCLDYNNNNSNNNKQNSTFYAHSSLKRVS